LVCIALVLAYPDAASGEPIVWYRYGTSGVATTLTDVSGNGNNGIATGSTFSTSRPPNANLIPGVPLSAGALSINGNAGSGGLSNASNIVTLPMIQASGGITFETWLFRNALNNNTSGVQDLLETEEVGLLIERNTDLVSWTNGQDARILTSTPVSIGEWHHIAGVFDSGANSIMGGSLQGSIRFYLDGSLILTAPTRIGSILDSDSRPVGIGRHPLQAITSETFNGMLFESRISLGALTPDELLLPAQAQSVPEPGSLVLLSLGSLAVVGWMRLRRSDLLLNRVP
jgi:hypothetical protein